LHCDAFAAKTAWELSHFNLIFSFPRYLYIPAAYIISRANNRRTHCYFSMALHTKTTQIHGLYIVLPSCATVLLPGPVADGGFQITSMSSWSLLN
jgi:hypothetical protein